jgi:ferredoxin
MQRSALRRLRIAVATALFAGLVSTLVGPHGRAQETVGHWLASTQFVASLLAVATGASLSLACILIVVAALLIGRVYCAAVCPFGVFQDIIARIADSIRRRKGILPYAPPLTWIRQLFLWGSVATVLMGFGGFTIALLDPYGNFGRIVSILFRPLIGTADRAAAGAAQLAGIPWHASPALPWGGLGVVALPAAILSLIIVLAAFRGRLYCNTVCPVGALLGLFSRRAAFRITIDRRTCRKCGECLRACKAQCIDLRNSAIDYSRCVACCDCLGVCENHSVEYRFAWKRDTGHGSAPLSSPIDSAKQPVSNTVADPQRRTFIATAAVAIVASIGGAKLTAAEKPNDQPLKRGQQNRLLRPISPPGSVSVDRFLARCVSCQLCVGACPTNVLQPSFREYGLSGVSKPHLDFSTGACEFDCRRCGEVCPSGAIGLLDLAEKQATRIGVVHFEASKCLVLTSGTACTICSEKCPTKAVRTVPVSGGLRLPEIQPLLCIGCGTCEHACPAKPQRAITVIGRRYHNRARKAVEGRIAAPATASISSVVRSTSQKREPVIM